MGIKKNRQVEVEKSTEIARLLELEKNYTYKHNALVQDREKLASEIETIKTTLEDEKIKASRNEEEMINEIVAVEEKIQINIELQKEKQKEIDTLKENIKRFEKERRRESKQKTKNFDSTRKRFATLYKTFLFKEEPFAGFIDLERAWKKR